MMNVLFNKIRNNAFFPTRTSNFVYPRSSYTTSHCNIYNPKQIEPKWQKQWEKKTPTDFSQTTKNKFYVLSMFPYPSGKLHMGHARVYTISDTVSRIHKMKDYKVLHPMGWDAFGLPAENAAIDRGIKPHEWTFDNIQQMKKTLLTLGFDFDWSQELSTCDPEYYKWTQWIFLKLYEKGLAYQQKSYVNWDPIDQTVLANEQVDEEGKSWRSGAFVEKKLMNQWYLKITDYTQWLLQDLDTLSEWPSKVVKMQKDWIGLSPGTMFEFNLEPVNNDSGNVNTISIFTTRPDTLFGVTYLVLAPDNPIVNDIVHPNYEETVKSYIKKTLTHTNQQRKTSKDGVPLGRTCIHPITKRRLPVYIASYVLGDYATGAVMGVPAHDLRDREFLSVMNLSDTENIIKVIEPESNEEQSIVYTGEGRLTNSGSFTGMKSLEAREAITQYAINMDLGKLLP